MSLPSSQRVLGIQRGGQHVTDYTSSSFSFFFSPPEDKCWWASGPQRATSCGLTLHLRGESVPLHQQISAWVKGLRSTGGIGGSTGPRLILLVRLFCHSVISRANAINLWQSTRARGQPKVRTWEGVISLSSSSSSSSSLWPPPTALRPLPSRARSPFGIHYPTQLGSFSDN